MELNKQIADLGQAVERLVASIVNLSEELFLARLNGWSPRDILAHLIGWNRHIIRGSQQIQRGELPFYDIDPGEDYSKVNEALVRQYNSTERLTLIEELRASSSELQVFLNSLDSEVWARDFGVRHQGIRVTIRDTVDELIDDYAHHHQQIEQHAEETGHYR